MFCKHKWSVLSETTTKSKIETMDKVLERNGKVFTTFPDYTHMYETKHIQIVTCSKCGKLKRFVERL